MKTQVTLLAVWLLGAGLANAQTSTTTNSSGTTTNSTSGTTPTTPTDNSTSSGTTNSTSPTGTSTSGSTMSNGTMNNSGSTTGTGTMSTGSTTGTGTMSNGTTTTTGTTSPSYGTTTTSTSDTYNTKRDKSTKDYKNFVFGIYAGLNTTKFKGETVNTGGNLKGRLGYQAGFFVRGGGRLYGQLGAEYFASSSNFFTAASGQTIKSIQSQIDIQYVQIPVYIGYKLVQSDRGISAVRLQVGLEYANRINSKSGDFKLTNAEIKSGTFNGLGQLGFDAGPVFLDLTYHYGFNNSINAVNSTGFAGSQRRILSASVGFKF